MFVLSELVSSGTSKLSLIVKLVVPFSDPGLKMALLTLQLAIVLKYQRIQVPIAQTQIIQL